jgi:hypothetical protein
MTSELLNSSATLLAAAIAVAGLVWAVHSYRKQMNAQLFLAFVTRYEVIMQSFPAAALESRLQLLGPPPPESEGLSLAILRYLNLCSEELYLHANGYLADDIWRIWEAELRRTLCSPLLRREWPRLRAEFESYPAFLDYVEATHGSRVS